MVLTLILLTTPPLLAALLIGTGRGPAAVRGRHGRPGPRHAAPAGGARRGA